MKRAGSAVELRPAPKARRAAHPQERQRSAAEGGMRDRVRPRDRLRGQPQERQHSAAEGGTRDRVRPAGALRMRRLRRPASGTVTRTGGDAGGDGGQLWRQCAALGATRLGPGPKGTRKKVCRSKHRSNFWFRTARSA